MKRIQFLGLHTPIKARSTGCSSCGGGSRLLKNGKFQREKRLTLPSGQTINFVLGQIQEVSDRDAEFLVKLTFDEGLSAGKEVFKIV